MVRPGREEVQHPIDRARARVVAASAGEPLTRDLRVAPGALRGKLQGIRVGAARFTNLGREPGLITLVGVI